MLCLLLLASTSFSFFFFLRCLLCFNLGHVSLSTHFGCLCVFVSMYCTIRRPILAVWAYVVGVLWDLVALSSFFQSWVLRESPLCVLCGPSSCHWVHNAIGLFMVDLQADWLWGSTLTSHCMSCSSGAHHLELKWSHPVLVPAKLSLWTCCILS